MLRVESWYEIVLDPKESKSANAKIINKNDFYKNDYF